MNLINYTKIKFMYVILFCMYINDLFTQPVLNLNDIDTTTMCTGDIRFNAEFPGGTKALLDYLQFNITNKTILSPEEANNIQKAFAKIIITEIGKVDSVSIIKTSLINRIDSLFKVTLIKMPDWKPAECNGKKIKQYVYIPLKLETK